MAAARTFVSSLASGVLFRRSVCIGTKSAPPPVHTKPLGVLSYKYVEGQAAIGETVREAHAAHAQEAAQTGDLLLGGVFESMDSGLLIFSSEDAADRFAERDPYVTEGLVTEVSVREWPVVAGALFDAICHGGHNNPA
mmetsp:Transcript_3466/g.9426  ORF Transcript_3466/g.9426 Transcript_3466/m.9426 type:complete len:138 (-) Transcript_3466:168-581(-)